MTVLTRLPGEKPVSTHKARLRSSEEQQEEGGSVGLPDLQWMLLGTRETCLKAEKQERKVSWDCNSEPRVKASEAACELTQPCSTQGTSGGLALSCLLLAASPLLSSVSALKFWMFISFSIFFSGRNWEWLLFSVHKLGAKWKDLLFSDISALAVLSSICILSCVCKNYLRCTNNQQSFFSDKWCPSGLHAGTSVI